MAELVLKEELAVVDVGEEAKEDEEQVGCGW